MKKLTKMFVGLLFVVALAVPAKAKNLTDVQMEVLDANYMAEYVASNNTEMIKLEYSGDEATSVVAISQTEISAYAPSGTLDTDFGGDGYYQFNNTAHDTIGELCSVIDLLDNYSCTMLAALYDDDPEFLRDQLYTESSSDLKSAGGLRIKSDTGTTSNPSNDESFFLRVGIEPLPGRRVLLKECSMSSFGTADLKAFGKLRKYEGSTDGVTRNTSTVVWSEATLLSATKTVTWTDANGHGGLLFAKDEHVVAGIDNDNTSEQAATNAIQCKWEER